MNGSGCKGCPVKPCETKYRGSICAARRAKLGLGDPLTNGERLRRMSDEELAEFIMLSPEMEFEVCEQCEVFRGHGAYTPCGTKNGWCTAELRCNAFKKWLKQPAKEEAKK